jgi:hypothetical protein
MTMRLNTTSTTGNLLATRVDVFAMSSRACRTSVIPVRDAPLRLAARIANQTSRGEATAHVPA